MVPLFQWLEDVLARDVGPAGFAGTIAIGVLPDGAALDSAGSWMHLVFDRGRPRVLWSDRLYPGVSAALALDEGAASALIDSGSAGRQPSCRRAGDRRLLERFVDRYLKPRNGLSLRCEGTERRRRR
jgi:hypothetical protein